MTAFIQNISGINIQITSPGYLDHGHIVDSSEFCQQQLDHIWYLLGRPPSSTVKYQRRNDKNTAC